LEGEEVKTYWIQSIKVVKFVKQVDAKAATTHQGVRQIWKNHCVQPVQARQWLAPRPTGR
jgi:hypothetical protein